jgi:hypothetical protein
MRLHRHARLMGDFRRMRSIGPLMRRVAALIVVLPAALVALPPTTVAATTESYTLGGYEVYFGTDQAVFVGTGSAADGLHDLSGWYTSVYHSVVIDPTGVVTGGTALLQRVDGVQISGTIVGGGATQTAAGDNCTTQTYAISAQLAGAIRSDAPGAVGTAEMTATLTHYRGWFLGSCWVYSARVDGAITVTI